MTWNARNALWHKGVCARRRPGQSACYSIGPAHPCRHTLRQIERGLGPRLRNWPTLRRCEFPRAWTKRNGEGWRQSRQRQFTGHIEQIGAIACLEFSSGWPITRNFILQIVLDQTDPRLKPGISGQITVVMDRVPDAVIIPAQAIFQKSGQNVAYVWRGTQFEERAIEVGRRSGDRIMVAKGVIAGEQVALKDPTSKE